VTSGGAALAQDFDLRALDGPIPGLSRTDLDRVVEQRDQCRKIVTFVDGLAALFHDAAEGTRKGEFRRAFANAKVDYGGIEGQCNVAIAAMSAGWPRAVIGDEAAHIDRLYHALFAAMEAFAEDQPADAVNARIQAYELLLQQWVSWLELSHRFWAGDFLVQRAKTCLVHQAEDAAEVRALLMQQVVLPPDGRDPEALGLARAKLDAAPAAMDECEGVSDLERVELRLLRDTFSTYRDALEGLLNDDDAAIRAAMATEQDLASRAARCRREYHDSSVTDDCKP